MKRVLAIAIAIAFAPLAGAQLYKYVDKDGKTVYTDQPPPNADARTVNVPKAPAAPAAPAKDAPAAGKSAVGKDKDLEKGREQAKEQQKKQEEAAEKERLAEQRCTQARAAFRLFSEGGRILKSNDKGERVYLGDAEIEAGREKARQEMDEACKKG
jgi:uncharacterized protein DUF4124